MAEKKAPSRPRTGVMRPHVVATRFNDAEIAQLDRMRGSLTRAEWLRWLQLQAVKRQ